MAEGKQSDMPGDAEQPAPPKNLPEPGVRPSRSEDIVSRQVAGETIMVPIKSSPGELDDIFTLNEVATSVWELIDGSRSISEISAAIASEYDVPPDQALSDTRELIAQFDQAAVITIGPAADQPSPGK